MRLKGLGKKQKELINWLKEDNTRYICHSTQWSPYLEEHELRDENGNTYKSIKGSLVTSLFQRGLIDVVFEYNTTQPDTNVMKLKLIFHS